MSAMPRCVERSGRTAAAGSWRPGLLLFCLPGCDHVHLLCNGCVPADGCVQTLNVSSTQLSSLGPDTVHVTLDGSAPVAVTDCSLPPAQTCGTVAVCIDTFNLTSVLAAVVSAGVVRCGSGD